MCPVAFWNRVSSFDNVFPNPIINLCCIFISSKPIWFGNLLQLFIFTDIICCYNLSVDIRICWHFMILMSFCWLDGGCLLRSSCCHSCHLFDWSCVLCCLCAPCLIYPVCLPPVCLSVGWPGSMIQQPPLQDRHAKKPVRALKKFANLLSELLISDN